MLSILITIVHVLVSFFLILVVLAQTGKGQDLASAFGGTGSQTAFGARSTATLLSKITAGAAFIFMLTSLSLSYLRPSITGDSVVPETNIPASVPAEAESSDPASGNALPSEEGATTESNNETDAEAQK